MSTTYAQRQSPAQKKDAPSAFSVFDASSQSESLQRKASMANGTAQRVEPPRPNNTGMPDNLKAGIENLSGFSMDDVRVHYNSSKPATVQALAYTQGTDIHVAPGQEKHLPHEAWHVAQQMAGRVSPTTNINGMPVNDNAALEHEADVMGEKAVQYMEMEYENLFSSEKSKVESKPIQRTIKVGELTWKKHEEKIRSCLNELDDVFFKSIFDQVLEKMPNGVKGACCVNSFSDGSEIKKLFFEYLSKWNGCSEQIYIYTSEKNGLEKLIKDVFKYYFHDKYGWVTIGVGEYMTGDVTGLGIAATLSPNVTLKILPYWKESSGIPTFMGPKVQPATVRPITSKEKFDLDHLRENLPDLFRLLWDNNQVRISRKGSKGFLNEDSLRKKLTADKDKERKGKYIRELKEMRKKELERDYGSEPKTKQFLKEFLTQEELKRQIDLINQRIIEINQQIIEFNQRIIEINQQIIEFNERIIELKGQIPEQNGEIIELNGLISQLKDSKEKNKKEKIRLENRKTSLKTKEKVLNRLCSKLKDDDGEVENGVENEAEIEVEKEAEIEAKNRWIEKKLIEENFEDAANKLWTSERDKIVAEELKKYDPRDAAVVYKDRFLNVNRTGKRPVKPWNRETWCATDIIGKKYKGGENKIAETLLPSKDRWPAIKNFKDDFLGEKQIGEREPCILLWQRLSGLKGGAHKELDSYPLMLKIIAGLILKNFNNRVIVLIGDKDDSGTESLDRTGLISYLGNAYSKTFKIVEFNNYWEDSKFSSLKEDRRNQYYFLKLLSDENDAISIGMRSGGLESSALLGIKTIFIDDLGNNAEQRMEFWAGKAAYQRGVKLFDEEFERHNSGPILNYKRLATVNCFMTSERDLFKKLDELELCINCDWAFDDQGLGVFDFADILKKFQEVFAKFKEKFNRYTGEFDRVQEQFAKKIDPDIIAKGEEKIGFLRKNEDAACHDVFLFLNDLSEKLKKTEKKCCSEADRNKMLKIIKEFRAYMEKRVMPDNEYIQLAGLLSFWLKPQNESREEKSGKDLGVGVIKSENSQGTGAIKQGKVESN